MSSVTTTRAKWRKRAVWTLVVLAVARVGVAIAVPIALRSAAAKRDLECEWERLDLSLLGGSVELQGLVVRPKSAESAVERAAPIVELERANFDVRMLDLVRLHPHVSVAAVDGLALHLNRASGGPWNFARHLPTENPAPRALENTASKPSEDDSRSAAAEREPAAYDLRLPFEIDELRLHDLVVFVEDQGVTPTISTRFAAHASAWHIGAEDRSGTFEATATSSNLLEAAHIRGELSTARDKAHVDIDAKIAGLQPQSIAGWLTFAGVEPRAQRLSFALLGEVKVDTIGAERHELKAAIALHDIRALVDEREHAALDSLTAEIASITPSRIVAPSLELSGVRARAEKLANGHFLACGFEITPPATSSEPAAAAGAVGPTIAWSIARIGLHGLALDFVDRSVEPAAKIELSRGEIEIANVGVDATRPSEPLTVNASFGIEGVASALTARGTVDVLNARKSVALQLDASHVTLSSVAGYLHAAGLESTLVDGALHATIAAHAETDARGRTTGELNVSDVAFQDTAELFALRGIDVVGFELDSAQHLLRCAAIEIHGTHVPLRREANGAIAAFGVRTLAARTATANAPGDVSAPTSTPANVASTNAAPMRIEIARFAVAENRLEWSDDTVEPPVHAVFDDCGLEITNLGLGGDPAKFAASGASIAVHSNAADLVKQLDITGTITTKPGPLDVAIELQGSASGITIARLQPYIDPTGIHENFVGASASGRIALHVRREPGVFVVDVSASDCKLSNDGQDIVGMKALAIDGAQFYSDKIRVKSIRVDEPRFVVRRDPVGSLLAAGLRIPRSVFEKSAVDPQSSTPPSTSKAQELLSGLPDLLIFSLRVSGGTLAWIDETRTPAVDAEARLDVALNSFATRARETPATFDLSIALPGSAEKIQVAGASGLSPTAAALGVHVVATGLHSGTLASYLPPGLACELRDGRLEFESTFQVASHAEGGMAMEADVEHFDYREAGAEKPLAALEHFAVSATRIDPAQWVFDFEQIVSSGVDVSARRGADGTLHALGFALSPRPASEKTPISAESSAAAKVRFDRTPSIRVAHLDLDLGHVQFTDEMRGPDARPIALTAKIAGTDAPIDVFGGPASIVFAATAPPLAENVRGELTVDISKDAPTFDAKILVDGIHGDAIRDLIPSLSTRLDASGLTNGRFTTGMHGALSWKRRGPLDFDLRGGVAAEIHVDPIEFAEVRDGNVTPLAGLGGIDVDVKSFDPKTGDLHITTLDVRKPSGRFSHEADGLHAFGFVLQPDAATTSETESSASKAVVVEAAAPNPLAQNSVASYSATQNSVEVRAMETTDVASAPIATPSEIRVDSLTIRGLDVEWRDTRSVPTTVVPLDDLDVEILKFTTRAFREPRTMRFNMYVGAGEIDLPKQTRAANALTGTLGSLGAMVAGESNTFEVTKHKVFDEVALTGRLAFFPALDGYAKLDVNALELRSVAGPAKDSGVEIGSGTLDTSVRMRFKPEQGMSVESALVFTDLSLSEPKSGPIENYLHLPVPLDTTLFLLRNDAGEHRIPFSFDLDEKGLDGGEVARAAVAAVSSVIARAVASAPFRIVGTFTDLLGLSGGAEKPTPPALVHYANAATVANDADIALAPIVERLRDDSDLVVVLQHRFGEGDLKRAEILANPSPRECMDLTARLRQRKAEYARARAELAGRARTEFGVGEEAEAARTSARLRDVERELGRIELTLDKTCDLLRPGAERAREKRTRTVAMSIARERLATLRAVLRASGVADIEKRVEMRSATLDVAEDGSPGTIVVALKKRG